VSALVAFRRDVPGLDADHRDRIERGGPQCLGVRFARVGQNVCGRTGFDDLAFGHHGDGLADLAHHPQVVRDEHVGQSGILLDLAQQVEHLSLNGDVERAGRLVAHQDLGSTGERAGDADALALPTGELDGAAMQGGRRQPDTVHQLRCPLRALTLVAHPLQPKRLADYIDGGQMRIQGPVRVLKDHLHTRSERAQRFLR